MMLEIKYQVKNSNPNSNWNLFSNHKLKWANEVQNRPMKTKIQSRNLTNIGKG